MASNTKPATIRAARESLRARIVPATEAHCFAVAADLHPEAAAEVRHSLGHGMSLGDGLNYARLRFPGTLCGLLDERPAAIFGCYRGATGAGVPWFMGTNDLMRHPWRLTRVGRRLVEAWTRQFGTLENVVPAGFSSVRWLTILGFDILPSQMAQCADGSLVRYHRFRRP